MSSVPVRIGLTVFALAAFVRAAAPEAAWPAHDGPVQDVAFSPDGARVATLGEDGKLKVFDAATHKPLAELAECLESGNDVRFGPDGKTVLTLARNDELARLDAAGKPAGRIALHSPPGGTSAFDVSPDGKTLAVVARGSLRVLNAADGAELKSWVVHENYGINAVAFSPDGKRVATAGTDHKALVIEPDTGNIVWECPLTLNGVAVAFSRDGRTLFTADSGSTVMAFDMGSGAGKTLSDGAVRAKRLVPSADGHWLYLGGTGKQPWRLALPDGKADEHALGGDAWNTALAVSPDGKWFAGGANDGTVQLWKTPAD